MSSHHFVKEGQEPAMLIIDPVEFSLAEPLLEWAPLVIVTSAALENVLEWGIKIDVVITGQESIDLIKEKLLKQTPIKIIGTDHHSAFETALYFLLANKQQAVSILTSDSLSAIEKAKNFMHKLGVNIFSESWKWSAISSGTFRKWMPAGSKVKFYGLPGMPSFGNNLGESEEGAEVLEDGFVDVSHPTPFWVGEAV
jgi:hypothetical protein